MMVNFWHALTCLVRVCAVSFSYEICSMCMISIPMFACSPGQQQGSLQNQFAPCGNHLDHNHICLRHKPLVQLADRLELDKPVVGNNKKHWYHHCLLRLNASIRSSYNRHSFLRALPGAVRSNTSSSITDLQPSLLNYRDSSTRFAHPNYHRMISIYNHQSLPGVRAHATTSYIHKIYNHLFLSKPLQFLQPSLPIGALPWGSLYTY